MRHDFLHTNEIASEVADTAIRAGRPVPRVEFHARNDMDWARGAAAPALSEATANLVDRAAVGAAE